MHHLRVPRLDIRLALGTLAFVLAALTAVWPIHARQATGASYNGTTGRIALSDFVSRSCPYELQLGHVRDAAPKPPGSEGTGYLINSYNDAACTAKRYDRTSEALLWMIIGTWLTVSRLRRRVRIAGLDRSLVAPAVPARS